MRRGVEALLRRESEPAEKAWRDPWATNDGFSLGPQRQLDLDVMVDGHPRKAAVVWHNGALVTVDGVRRPGRAHRTGAGGVVAIGHGVQRHVALKSYETVDVDHLEATAPSRRRCTARCWRFSSRPAQRHQGRARRRGRGDEDGACAAGAARRHGQRNFRAGRRAGRRRREDPDDRTKRRIMPLHLLKLCVGFNSVQDLEDWIKQRLKKEKAGESPSTSTPPGWCRSASTSSSTAARLLGDQGRDPLPRAAAGDPAVHRQGRHRPLPAGDGRQAAAGAAAPVPRLPGLALSCRPRTRPQDLDRAAPGARHMPEQMRRELRELGLL